MSIKKIITISALLLASFGAQAFTYNCEGQALVNGQNEKGEFISMNGHNFYHSGTSQDGSSIFISEDKDAELFVKWVNAALTVMTFKAVGVPANTFTCNSPK